MIDISCLTCYTYNMSTYELSAEQKGYYLFRRRGDYETPAHFHGAVEFLFVQSGEQEVIIDGERRTLSAGEACFVDSFSVHAYFLAPEATVHILLGEKQYFDRCFSAFGNKVPPKFFPFKDFELLSSLIAFCGREWTNEVHKSENFEGCVKILCSAIAESIPLLPRQTDKASSLVGEILKYTEKHIQNDLSLRAIAQQFGYSHEHLSRLLHKYLSENWNSYVNRIRARKVESLLTANPDASVLNIAYECGFESPNTFYRAYKKEFGKKPRQD